MTCHDTPDVSTGLKKKTEKLWENLSFTYVYVNIKHTSIELTRRLACCWACASAALNLSVSSVCSAASGAVRCSSPTMSTRHKNCKEALLCVGFTHPGPTACGACNSATLSLSCWTWRPRGCKKLKICWSIGWICCIRKSSNPTFPSTPFIQHNLQCICFSFRKWRNYCRQLGLWLIIPMQRPQHVHGPRIS